jgi:hypothetical protein
MKNRKMLKGSAFAVTLILPVILVMGAIFVPAMIGWKTKADTRTAEAAAKQLYVNTVAIIVENEENPDFELQAYYDADTDPEFTAEIYRLFPDLKNYVEWYVEIATKTTSDYYVDIGTVLLAYVYDGDTEGFYPSGGYRVDGSYYNSNVN